PSSTSLFSHFSFFMTRPPPTSTLFPYTTLFRSNSPTHGVPFGSRAPVDPESGALSVGVPVPNCEAKVVDLTDPSREVAPGEIGEDRKSTRLNSSHVKISYAVFCLKKKKKNKRRK